MDMINGLDPAKHESAAMRDACAVTGVTHGTCVRPEPKRYLDPCEREILFREGGMNAVYAAESGAADEAGDADASWAWLAMGELPADVLLFWKRRRGAAFIRKWGFSTRYADAAYGPGWLDME